MSGVALVHFPKFLSFAYSLLYSGGVQGDETVYLPAELSAADYWDFLLNEKPDVFGDHDIRCVRFGCLIALLCDEADRMAEGWDLDLSVDPQLLRLSEVVPWINEQPALSEAVLAAARNPRGTTIDKVVRLTLLPWWQEVSIMWTESSREKKPANDPLAEFRTD